eukprot:CAMPEP_0180153398 /NCGR_PEP_ID=MMETSP0986-20121125/23492_1 /TAXON_ID=697907 /ORGANISM="non described non described, Strain CCMP2293" /LENGTH=199 /DNA_ID=CAMNT_0022101459 /DNA_START=155 /DNA_END=750 /DNA_ORIENTATION=-
MKTSAPTQGLFSPEAPTNTTTREAATRKAHALRMVASEAPSVDQVINGLIRALALPPRRQTLLHPFRAPNVSRDVAPVFRGFDVLFDPAPMEAPHADVLAQVVDEPLHDLKLPVLRRSEKGRKVPPETLTVAVGSAPAATSARATSTLPAGVARPPHRRADGYEPFRPLVADQPLDDVQVALARGPLECGEPRAPDADA